MIMVPMEIMAPKKSTIQMESKLRRNQRQLIKQSNERRNERRKRQQE